MSETTNSPAAEGAPEYITKIKDIVVYDAAGKVVCRAATGFAFGPLPNGIDLIDPQPTDPALKIDDRYRLDYELLNGQKKTANLRYKGQHGDRYHFDSMP